MFEISAHPLPSNFKGTPQQLLDAWLERLVVTGDNVAIISSDVMPTGNQGPWLKNGTQLWVWDETTQAYRPVDVTNSVSPEVYIGPDAPDPLTYPLWFKTSGSTALGLYTYLGGSWVTQDVGIHTGDVTEQKIADIAVTTEKIAPLAVTSEKLANGLSLDIWEAGAANTFARMNSVGTSAIWESGRVTFEDLAITLGANHEFVHDLGTVPHRVEVYLVAQSTMTFSGTDFQTLFAGDAVPVDSQSRTYAIRVVSTASKVMINIPLASAFRQQVGFASSPTTYPLSNFKLRVHVTPA